eukprot:12581_1
MSIEQIDKQLKEYYQSLQAPYDELFSIYCEDNGIDDDSLAAELEEEDGDTSILVDFDDDFPYARPPKNDSDRDEKIFSLIKKCYSKQGFPPIALVSNKVQPMHLQQHEGSCTLNILEIIINLQVNNKPSISLINNTLSITSKYINEIFLGIGNILPNVTR